MKYLTYEGRLRIVYAYHFRFLYQIRNLSYHPSHQRLCISHFLLHSLFEMCERVKRGNPDAIAHHGLIKLIIFQKLQELTLPIEWVRFTHFGMEHERPFGIQSMTPPPPLVAKEKGHLTPKKSLKKKYPKRKNVEVSDKEVLNTHIHLSTPVKAKKPRIIVRSPPSSPKPAKRVKMISHTQASKAKATSSPKVVSISPEPEEEARTDPQDFELLGLRNP